MRKILLALALFLVSSLAQADTRIGRWTAVLDTDETQTWTVSKNKRQTKLTFSVTSRHISDEEVGRDILVECVIERLSDKGEWEWAEGGMGTYYRKSCSVTVPVAKGTYRLRLTNFFLSSRAEFTVELYQGVTEG